MLKGFVHFWNLAGVIVSASGYDTSNEILRSAALMLSINIFNTLVSLPFSIYRTFVLEEKHGFNKEVNKIFVWLCSNVTIPGWMAKKLVTKISLQMLTLILQVIGDKNTGNSCYFFVPNTSN